MRRAFLMVTFTLATALALAQDAPPPAPVAPAAPVPLVDAANALSGSALVAALRGGGYVLLMRHARQGRFTDACPSTDPGLTPEGEAQARKVGTALREWRIPFGSVRASKLCRAIETARLLDAGLVASTADLNPATPADVELHAGRARLLAETPKPGTNTLLVSHAHNGVKDGERVRYELTEIIVFRPDGRGGSVAVARIRPEDWDALPK